MTVVGDQHETTPVGRQPLLEKLDGIEVEVVGRLVEDQHLVLAHQQAGQGHPLGLATRQLAGEGIDQPGHAQPVEHRLALPAGPHRVAHRPFGKHRLLGQEPDPHPAPPPDLTRLRFELAGEHAQQGALAATVDAHHTHPVAVGDGERETGEQGPVGAGGNEALGVDQDHVKCSSVEVSKNEDRQARGPGDLWWAGKDSNLRRLCRLIYSQLPLATRAPTHQRKMRLPPSLGLTHAHL